MTPQEEIADLRRQLRLAQHNFEHYYTRYMAATGKTTAECEAEWEKTNPIIYGFPAAADPKLGSATQAIEFALKHIDDVYSDKDAFLEDWQHGDIAEWPEYVAFLEKEAADEKA